MTTTTNFIEVRGIRHYYEFLNKEFLSPEKPLLVFLHEGLGSVKQWKEFPALLSNKLGYAALLYDRYGHGLSEELHGKRKFNFMHEQAQVFLPELFKNLDVQQHKKIIIGHSDGGSIGLIHAGSFHENIIGVISEAAHVIIEDISVRGIEWAVKNFEGGPLKKFLRPYHADKTDSMFYGWAHTWLKADFKEWNIEEYLPRIKAPLLAIQGADDQYGSFAQLEVIKKHIPSARIEFIKNCGHVPHLQKTEAVLEMMRDFILGL